MIEKDKQAGTNQPPNGAEATEELVADNLEELVDSDVSDVEAIANQVAAQVDGDEPSAQAVAAAEQATAAEPGVSQADPMAAQMVEQLNQTVASLKAQVEDRTSQYIRIAADFENFRKRTAKEKEDMQDQIRCSTVTEVLPVVDNFERARSQIKPQTDAEMAIHKSYQGVYKQLVDCLKRVGVAPMRAEGEEFDPNLHEAVMREPTAEHPEGTVIEQLVRGYMLNDRVLRHAMVKVAAPPEPVIPSDQEGASEVSES